MKSKRIENPCRPGTAAHAVIAVLLRAGGKPVTAGEIGKRGGLSADKAKRVLQTLQNPFHNAAIAKAGLAIKRSGDGGFSIASCRPNPTAHRPEAKKKAGKKSPKRRSDKKPARKRVSPNRRAKRTPATKIETAPVAPTVGIVATAASAADAHMGA